MRGRSPQRSMLAIVDLEKRVPRDHPLRRIKAVADAALDQLSPEFDCMYPRVGRASVPPERLLKACLLITLYSVRSERAFCQELEYNLLYRWVPGHGPDGAQLRRHRLHQEPTTTDGPRRGSGLVRRGGVGGRRGGTTVGRALQRGRDPDRGRGQPQELPVQGRNSGTAHERRSGQPVDGLPGATPTQRDACQHHGS